MRPTETDELGRLIRQEATRHAPPPALAERIRAGLRSADDAQARVPPRRPKVRPRWPQALALFGAGAATAWGLSFVLLLGTASNVLGDAVTDSHIRSLMAGHLTDVVSSDHHTVKPWFAGKLDFSPPVVDLAAEGHPLIGARLDYIEGRAVAALVYRSGQHVVNLFIWPDPRDGASAPQVLARRGYNTVRWTEGGMQVWAVSDLNAAELQAFAKLVRERMGAAQPPAS
ncbi:anti-sigma factor [Variovorax sp. YR216]|uniref:anti-sigma factor family protein n=1 Tax=Variovorax sp. YR216 TaxID=1882828 RepID=UPI000897198C|nr:anti-sigma factor [Variovorax sp. YR216]SEA90657.1 Transmembrane transcriptional regulator (anti-sigma factor RsiW) [Variovorax sp. YR216]